MKNLLGKTSAALIAAFGLAGAAHAIPVTIHMTADNILFAGLCSDGDCTSGVTFALENADDWRTADSVELDLGAGTWWFAWNVQNDGEASAGNPAALLAQILWDGNANYSSSAWENHNPLTGAFIANATEWGSNGGSNTWTSNNGGQPIAGISTSANWIYTANNFANADQSAFFRTSITIVPEPTTLSLLGMSLLGLALFRRQKRA